MEHLDTFLAGHPPFDALAPEQLRELAAAGDGPRLRAGRRGAGRGRPARHRDVGGPDRIDGRRALGRGDPGARARRVLRASVAADRDGAGVHRARPRAVELRAVRARAPRGGCWPPRPGVAYVAGSMRKRLTRAGHTVHGLHDVGTTPVSAIMRPPVYAEPTETLRSAAQRLGEDHVQALLVAMPDETIGIVTDAEVRAAVAAGELSPDAPAARDRPRARRRPCRCAAGDRGDRRHAGRRRGAHGGARRRARVRGPVGRRPARARRPQPDRAAPHDPRRRRRGRARRRRSRICRSCSWPCRGPACPRGTWAGC